MDLTDFLPTIGVGVGALATLGGVWITARSSRKAEERRLDLEARREDVRIAREDLAEQRAADEAVARKQQETYDTLASLFIGELSSLRAKQATTDESWEGLGRWWDGEWRVQGEMRFMRALSAMSRDDHRDRVANIVNALSNQFEAASLNWVEHGEFIERLLQLGFELTSAYARGGEPSQSVEDQWQTFQKQLAVVERYRAARLQKETETIVERGRRAVEAILAKKGDQLLSDATGNGVEPDEPAE